MRIDFFGGNDVRRRERGEHFFEPDLVRQQGERKLCKLSGVSAVTAPAELEEEVQIVLLASRHGIG